MSKLFKLKDWLTVVDAARHLAIVFDEDVTEADVLRLALDGRLRLSVHFVNHAKARCGKVVRYTDAELGAAIESGELPDDLNWTKFPKDLAAAMRGERGGEEIILLTSIKLGKDRYLTLSEDITTLQGIWDLPMIGSERLDIEHRYQMLTDGPSVTLQGLDGAFVEGADGYMCQLQENYDENEYQAGSEAQLEKLKLRCVEMVALDPSEECAAEVKALLNKHAEDRKNFLEKRMARPEKENYYPAGGLPDDAVIVVRTEALREFEQSINGTSKLQGKPISMVERNTLLTIIAALCDHSAIKVDARGSAIQIAKLTDEIGASVSDDTVRRWLREIPDALGSRMK